MPIILCFIGVYGRFIPGYSLFYTVIPGYSCQKGVPPPCIALGLSRKDRKVRNLLFYTFSHEKRALHIPTILVHTHSL